MTRQALVKPLLLAVVALACFATIASAQSEGAAAQTVTVDWIEQIMAGGWTMIFLALLSLAMVAFIVERSLFVRRKRFVPPELLDDVLPLIKRRDWTGALKAAEQRPSTMANIVTFAITHRNNPYEKLAAVVSDIGARDVVDQEERTYPLALVAGVAPLLGLLGTMIGMIEAFQLVSIYGDEGGASMLAGSIAKALITTAFGLILAIPALIAYHYFRRRVHTIAVELDTQTERFLTECFFQRSDAVAASPRAAKATGPAKPGTAHPDAIAPAGAARNA